jgi:hypothetical protein
MNSRVSSAERGWLTAGAVEATFNPCKVDDSLLVSKRHDRTSAANKNKYDDIGLP